MTERGPYNPLDKLNLANSIASALLSTPVSPLSHPRALLGILLGLCAALAQAGAPAERWSGTGKDFGRGWRQDADGSWHGTGRDFGRGWRQDPNGSWHGTGKDFGRGWRQDPNGTWHGTGKDFGSGWRPP